MKYLSILLLIVLHGCFWRHDPAPKRTSLRIIIQDEQGNNLFKSMNSTIQMIDQGSLRELNETDQLDIITNKDHIDVLLVKQHPPKFKDSITIEFSENNNILLYTKIQLRSRICTNSVWRKYL